MIAFLTVSMYSSFPYCLHVQFLSSLFACTVVCLLSACTAVFLPVCMYSCFPHCLHVQLFSSQSACTVVFLTVCTYSCFPHCLHVQLFSSLFACTIAFLTVCMYSERTEVDSGQRTAVYHHESSCDDPMRFTGRDNPGTN